MKLKNSVRSKKPRQSGIKSIILLIFCTTGIEVHGGDLSPNRYAVEAGASIHRLKNSYIGIVPISTYGIHGTFPVQPDNISVRFSAEHGLVMKKNIVQKTDIFLTEIALSRKFFLYTDILTINPCLLLVNYALHLNPTDDARDALLIHSWENEFGAGIGCDITVRYKLFIVSIPVSASLLFTDKVASVFSSGLKAGITFQQKRRSKP